MRRSYNFLGILDEYSAVFSCYFFVVGNSFFNFVRQFEKDKNGF